MTDVPKIDGLTVGYCTVAAATLERALEQSRRWRRAFARMEAGIALENATRCDREIAAIKRGDFSFYALDALRSDAARWRAIARELLIAAP